MIQGLVYVAYVMAAWVLGLMCQTDTTLIAVLVDAINAELNDIRLREVIRTVRSAVSSLSCQHYQCVLMSLSTAAAAD